MASYQHAVNVARNAYFTYLIASHDYNRRVLFKLFIDQLLASLLTPPQRNVRNCFSIMWIRSCRSDSCLAPFLEKLTDSHLHFPLTNFNEISLSSLRRIVATSRSSTCLSDCLPTWFLKFVFQTVCSDILTVVNLSLSTGIFPSCLKHALIYPLLKKPTLDASVLNNFRPISKLPFLSGLL